MQALESRLAADNALQAALLQQVQQSNALLARLNERSWLQRMVG